jgi:hypothetical protein
MINQNSQFFAILTNVGVAKQANADALGVAWKITQMAVGDANDADPVPNATQTKLVNERRRAPLNQLKVDPTNAAIIIAEQVIPAEVGGWWIREIGLYDADGDLVAIANCAPSFKPLLTQGSGRTQVVRVNLLVSNSSSVELKIDPSVVLATRAYVDDKVTSEINKLDNKQSVKAATVGPVALFGLRSVDSEPVGVNDRILVKDQADATQNGIWLAAENAWSRAGDADESPEVTPNLIVSIERGAVNADTIWQLVTDGTITLGATALNFQNITRGLAPLYSPEFSGSPRAPLQTVFTADKTVATTQFVQRALGSLSGQANYAVDTVLTVDAVGKLNVMNGNGRTLTLPDSTQCPPGAIVRVMVVGPCTVRPVAGEHIVLGTTQSESIAMSAMTNAKFRRLLDGGGWSLDGGDAALPYSPMFQALLADNGWSREPSGMFEQWGTASGDVNGTISVTFPLAWPNGCKSLSAMHLGGDVAPVIAIASTLTKTGIQLRIKNLQGGTQVGWFVYWRARGY